MFYSVNGTADSDGCEVLINEAGSKLSVVTRCLEFYTLEQGFTNIRITVAVESD